MRFALLLITFSLSARAQEHLRLEDAEALAVQNHPRIAVAAAEAAAARATAAQIRAPMSPQLEGGVTASVAEHGTRLGIGGVNAPDLFSRVGMGFSLSQLITDFRRTALSVASAEETARGRSASAQATTAEVRLQVRVAYYRALEAEAAMAVADQVQKSRQLLLRQVKAFADSELRSTVDVGFAEVRLSEAELLTIRADNERRAAMIELASAMGLDAPSNWTLEEPTAPPAVLSVDEAIEHAIRQRPDLAALRHHLEAARKQLESDRRLNLPTIGAVGIGGYIPAGDPRLRPRYAGAAVNVTIPVLNGNLFAARRQESEARAIAAEKQQRDLLVRLRAGVRLSYLNYATAQSTVETARRLQNQAQRTFRLSEARYSAGLGTIVEFNQAQVDVVSAQLAYAAARYEAGMRMARLEFEIGNLI